MIINPIITGFMPLFGDELPAVPVALNSDILSKDSISKTPGHITVRLMPPIPAGLTRQELMTKSRVIETESRKLHPNHLAEQINQKGSGIVTDFQAGIIDSAMCLAATDPCSTF